MKDFNIYECIQMANFSKLAYSPFESDYSGLSMDCDRMGFVLLDIFVDPASSTQAFLAKHKTENIAVVAFRGTSEVYSDILTDIMGRLVDDGHEGIFNALESIRAKLEKSLDEKCFGVPLIATGHSLGGGLAIASILKMPKASWLKAYTFGSPPVCSAKLAAESAVPVYRIVNAGDIVSRVMSLPKMHTAIFDVMSAIKQVLLERKAEIDFYDDAHKYVEKMRSDLPSYIHLGEERLLNRSGRFITAKESLDVFFAEMKTDIKRTFEDHGIVQYIANLEKYRENAVV